MKAKGGSLCSGAGMLDRALESLFGVDYVWHAENDPAAASVLHARWPRVPNLGDITAIGGPHGLPRRHLTAPRRRRRAGRVFDRRVRAWQDEVDTVDLLAAGFPCQPFSAAGRRSGSADERHLWPVAVLPSIAGLMPSVVVLENVANLLTIESGTVFGQILADLDELGYSVSWTLVGACKVGACHHRHRLFVLAVRSAEVRVPASEPLAERHGLGWAPIQQVLFGEAGAVRWPPSGVSRDGLVWPLPVDSCGDSGIMLLPTPTAHCEPSRRGLVSVGVAQRRMDSGRRNLEDAISLLPTSRDEGCGVSTGVAMLPTPTARDATRGAGRPYPEGRPLSEVVALLPTSGVSDAEKGGRNQGGLAGDVLPPSSVQPGRFGRYEAAVRRHERLLGLPVPEPTELGRSGNPRMTAAFPEWMMALPRGWMTDVVPRNDAIRIAGNGVVGAVVEYALPTLPTFPAAVSLLTPAELGVAA